MPFAQERRGPGRPSESVFLCSGRDSPVRCANCGGHLSATVHQRGRTYPDGEVRRHYRTLRPHGCGQTVADVRALDAAISAMTLQRLLDPQQLATIKEIQEERRTQRDAHTAETARLRDLRAYFDGRLRDGHLTTNEHAAAVAGLDERISAGRRALRALDAAADLDDDVIGRIVTGWEHAAPAVRYRDLRRVWAGYQIYVTPGSSMDTEAQVRERILRPTRIPGTPPS